MKHLGVIGLLIGLVTATAALANPIPDYVPEQMNEFARKAPAGLEGHERSRFVRMLAQFSFTYFDQEARELMIENWDIYGPLMVESQRPSVSVNKELLTWFRLNAPDTLRAPMCASLREWFTSEITDAPYGGMMQTLKPESSVQRQIALERVEAAGQLALLGDLSAEHLLREFVDAIESNMILSSEARAEIREEAEWMLRRFERLHNEDEPMEGDGS